MMVSAKTAHAPIMEPQLQKSELLEAINNHDDLKIVETDDLCVVVLANTGRAYRVWFDKVIRYGADQIMECLTGKREPVELYTYSRVIGYYSRIDNWNKSKLGELKDRRAGSYLIGEERAPKRIGAASRAAG